MLHPPPYTHSLRAPRLRAVLTSPSVSRPVHRTTTATCCTPQVSGLDGKAASFPRAGGNEGVGRVVEAGPASTLRKGDVVVASAPGVGTWATHVVAEGASFTKVEGAAPGSAGFPVETAAVAVGAPLTAKHLLASVALSAGDVLVQNNAASLVGQAVIQYAAAAGVQTVNIVSKAAVADWANAVYHLQVSGMAYACWAFSEPVLSCLLLPATRRHSELTVPRTPTPTHPTPHRAWAQPSWWTTRTRARPPSQSCSPTCPRPSWD